MLYHLIVLASNDNGTPRKQDLLSGGQKKLQTNVRTLRGHNGAITALHCVTKREVWDLVGDREDAGFFISGSTDCSVSLNIYNVDIWNYLLTRCFIAFRMKELICWACANFRLRYGILVFVVPNSGQL